MFSKEACYYDPTTPFTLPLFLTNVCIELSLQFGLRHCALLIPEAVQSSALLILQVFVQPYWVDKDVHVFFQPMHA
jgi:hypothetical protein